MGCLLEYKSKNVGNKNISQENNIVVGRQSSCPSFNPATSSLTRDRLPSPFGVIYWKQLENK
jgi:hypothetical protein